LISSEAILGLPGYQITGIVESAGMVKIRVRYLGSPTCPHCGSQHLRRKDKRWRQPRHESWGLRHTQLELESNKYLCRQCGRTFWERFPGLLARMRATEPMRRSVFQAHYDGINRSRLGQREGIGAATVERWFLDLLARQDRERRSSPCPRVLGIDEHFFSKKDGYATTFCDLAKHRIFDVVLGRSEAALEQYLAKLEGKHRVRVVCIDLSSAYRSLVRKHFPQAKIVADRFHVIGLINHHFLTCWRQLDPVGSQHRGLLSLMRRHRHHLRPEQVVKLGAYLEKFPVLEVIYAFKQRLCYLLLKKHRTRKQSIPLVKRFLKAIEQLKQSGLAPLVQLGQTLACWAVEIAAMFRFTRNNGITEGFHTKMEVMQRQAYGFRNFGNYRMRVRVMCG
jgi:transposase